MVKPEKRYNISPSGRVDLPQADINQALSEAGIDPNQYREDEPQTEQQTPNPTQGGELIELHQPIGKPATSEETDPLSRRQNLSLAEIRRQSEETMATADDSDLETPGGRDVIHIGERIAEEKTAEVTQLIEQANEKIFDYLELIANLDEKRIELEKDPNVDIEQLAEVILSLRKIRGKYNQLEGFLEKLTGDQYADASTDQLDQTHDLKSAVIENLETGMDEKEIIQTAALIADQQDYANEEEKLKAIRKIAQEIKESGQIMSTAEMSEDQIIEEATKLVDEQDFANEKARQNAISATVDEIKKTGKFVDAKGNEYRVIKSKGFSKEEMAEHIALLKGDIRSIEVEQAIRDLQAEEQMSTEQASAQQASA